MSKKIVSKAFSPYRTVGALGQGATPLKILADQLILFKAEAGRLCPEHYYVTPGFSDLPSALKFGLDTLLDTLMKAVKLLEHPPHRCA